MNRSSQSILEYAILVVLITIALMAMSLYFRRGIQSVIKIAADEAGNQKEAEDIDPLKGIKASSIITRHIETAQRKRVLEGGSQISDLNMVATSSGSSTSVSVQEK